MMPATVFESALQLSQYIVQLNLSVSRGMSLLPGSGSWYVTSSVPSWLASNARWLNSIGIAPRALFSQPVITVAVVVTSQLGIPRSPLKLLLWGLVTVAVKYQPGFPADLDTVT